MQKKNLRPLKTKSLNIFAWLHTSCRHHHSIFKQELYTYHGFKQTFMSTRCNCLNSAEQRYWEEAETSLTQESHFSSPNVPWHTHSTEKEHTPPFTVELEFLKQAPPVDYQWIFSALLNYADAHLQTETAIYNIHGQNTTQGPEQPTSWEKKSPKIIIKGSIMLINLEANGYNESVLQFNLIPTEGAVYI